MEGRKNRAQTQTHILAYKIVEPKYTLFDK